MFIYSTFVFFPAIPVLKFPRALSLASRGGERLRGTLSLDILSRVGTADRCAGEDHFHESYFSSVNRPRFTCVLRSYVAAVSLRCPLSAPCNEGIKKKKWVPCEKCLVHIVRYDYGSSLLCRPDSPISRKLFLVCPRWVTAGCAPARVSVRVCCVCACVRVCVDATACGRREDEVRCNYANWSWPCRANEREFCDGITASNLAEINTPKKRHC